jgi:cobyrinic acid a,c-diamide synthase
MSIPRLLLAPSHRTGLANAVAAALAEIVTAQGRKVRYHHLGPLSPANCWDRWEGTAFLDPDLYDQESLLRLYDVATRSANLSLLSASQGVLDRRQDSRWRPADVARHLDCPVILVLDCRNWGAGIQALVSGLKSQLSSVNLAGALLSGVADRGHYQVLRDALTAEAIPVVGSLFEGDGPGWDTPAPGAWGLPLDQSLLEAVERQVDVAALADLAGQRGFLATQNLLTDRGSEGPLVMVAGGNGFTPWSRDSIEVLRAAGARIHRLDLLEDDVLPAEAAGLVLAGTIWPSSLLDIALNQSLLYDMRTRIAGGMPTVALAGGFLVLLNRVQDSLGRTVELAGVLPGEGEILWDLEDAAYVELVAARENPLLEKGQRAKGWVLTDVDIPDPAPTWAPPLTLLGAGAPAKDQPEGAGTPSLLCSRALIHLAAAPGMAGRFVQECAVYASGRFW